MLTYPLIDISRLKKHVREIDPNIVNLKSCELLHPQLDNIFKNFIFFDTSIIQYYPTFQKIIKQISDTYNISSDKVTISAGSDSIISIIVEALGTTTGRLILQSPNYFSWHNYPVLRKIFVYEIKFGASATHTFKLADFIEKIEEVPPSLVVISNPNSPTGFTFTISEIKELSAACKAYGHILVIDECFARFSNFNHYKVLGQQDHIIFIKSFSKSFGIAGARIAITFASKKITEYISHWRPEAAISGVSVHILENILQHTEQFEEICDDIILSREKFISAIKLIQPTWKALPSGGNYVTFFLGNSYDADTVTEFLLINGFRISNISKLSGLNNCIRIGVGYWNIMQKLVDVIKLIKY